MPRVSCVVFAARFLERADVVGKDILDVGACNFNGSIRSLIESFEPKSYLGVDMIEGPCVDKVMNADDLEKTFGQEKFDIVMSMEMMEHTRYWRNSITNMKRVLKRGGLLILTSPAQGYLYHGYPHDFWRYEVDDFKNIFEDFEILAVESDPDGVPGTFIAARKPIDYQEKDISQIELFSVVTGKRMVDLTEEDFKCAYFKRLVFKIKIKAFMENAYRGVGRFITKIFGLK